MIGTLERSKESVAKLMVRFMEARKHIDWCHKVIAENYSPIGKDEIVGYRGRHFCQFIGLQALPTPILPDCARAANYKEWHCNHTVSRDGVCGVHWNILFSHEWKFTGKQKYNKSLEFEAFCSLCGAPRSEATLNEKCPHKGEQQWLEQELSNLRSRL